MLAVEKKKKGRRTSVCIEGREIAATVLMREEKGKKGKTGETVQHGINSQKRMGPHLRRREESITKSFQVEKGKAEMPMKEGGERTVLPL